MWNLYDRYKFNLIFTISPFHHFATSLPVQNLSIFTETLFDMEWIEKLDGNVIVCDASGTIIYMNEKAIASYEKDGGRELIGRDLLECHSESSRKKIMEIMASGRKNVYTIEKQGKKKIIYQSPWFVGGNFRGIIELSLEIPSEMPHYIR
jgi:transcriptional regulator with PAS, ATPase and Fis domain